MWQKVTVALVIILFLFPWPVLADTPDDCSSLSGQAKVDCYAQKLSSSQGQEKTLSSQLATINNEISLTTSKIDLTQEKLDRLNDDIASVSGKIVSIESSLNQVSTVLLNRITETYIAGRTDPVLYLLSSANVNDLLDRLNYLQIVQKHDKTLMFQMTATKKNYNDQKNLLVDKKPR